MPNFTIRKAKGERAGVVIKNLTSGRLIVTEIALGSPFFTTDMKEGQELLQVNYKDAEKYGSVAAVVAAIKDTDGQLTLTTKRMNHAEMAAQKKRDVEKRSKMTKKVEKVASVYSFHGGKGNDWKQPDLTKLRFYSPLTIEFSLFSEASTVLDEALDEDHIARFVKQPIRTNDSSSNDRVTSSLNSKLDYHFQYLASELNTKVLPDINSKLKQHGFRATFSKFNLLDHEYLLYKFNLLQGGSSKTQLSALSSVASLASEFDPTPVSSMVEMASGIASKGAKGRPISVRPFLMVIVEPLDTFVVDVKSQQKKLKDLENQMKKPEQAAAQTAKQ